MGHDNWQAGRPTLGAARRVLGRCTGAEMNLVQTDHTDAKPYLLIQPAPCIIDKQKLGLNVSTVPCSDILNPCLLPAKAIISHQTDLWTDGGRDREP